MLGDGFLCSQLVSLKNREQWVSRGEGLWFIFPKGGTGTLVCGGVSLPLKPGDVVVLNAPTRGKLSADGEMLFWSFSVAFEHILLFLTSKEMAHLQQVREHLSESKVYSASTDVARTCHQLLSEVPLWPSLDQRTQLLRIVSTVLMAEFQQAPVEDPGDSVNGKHFLRVFSRISPSELLGLSVPDLARHFRCSRRHLNRLFHQHFGMSVTGLRMELRLLKAVSLLRTPNARVRNVAIQSGFNHMGLFTACFRRRFGLSPGEWQQHLSQTENRTKRRVAADAACQVRQIGLCPWKEDRPNPRPLPTTSSSLPSRDGHLNAQRLSVQACASLLNFGHGNPLSKLPGKTTGGTGRAG